MSTPTARLLAPGANFGFPAGRPVNRFERNQLAPDRYRTFQAAVPRENWRTASCAEVECERYEQGWLVEIDALTDVQRQAVLGSKYRFAEEDHDGTRVWHFEAGQPCFYGHKVPVAALFLVRNGDHRASEVIHQHKTPEAWRDDCAEHQDRWATIVGRG